VKSIYPLLTQDVSSAKFWHQKLQNFLKFLYFISKGLDDKYCLQKAAAMAYTSLLAMVPALVVFLSVFSSVSFFPKHLKAQLQSWIFKNFIPETSQKLSDQIEQHVQNFASSATAIGLIGAVFMVVTVFFLLNTIEHTFNSMMDVSVERTWLYKLFAYTFIMVWSPVLAGFSMYFGFQASLFVEFSALVQLNFLLRYGLIVVVFTTAYKVIPNKTISTSAALLGGICGALLWEFARSHFGDFVSRMVSYDKIYGTIGVIPMFLLWLYIAWLIVLVGMEIVYVCQNREALYSSLKASRESDALAIRLVEKLGQQFQTGKKFETEQSLAKFLSVSETDLQKLLTPLMEKEMVVALHKKQFALAKSPEHILLWELVALFNPSIQLQQCGRESEVQYLPLGVPLDKVFAGLTLAAHLKSK
jgi:membrane protein